jgi:hypothetical protein
MKLDDRAYIADFMTIESYIEVLLMVSSQLFGWLQCCLGNQVILT